MQSRKSILAALRYHQQADSTSLPPIEPFRSGECELVDTFSRSVVGVGGRVIVLETIDKVEHAIRDYLVQTGRIVTTIPALHKIGELVTETVSKPREYADVTLSVLPAHFAVAENGAVWLSEQMMGHRVLPFICQHLAIVLRSQCIVASMHDAYKQLGTAEYGFGIFISGPSKTADIEQFLIMGAHGPKTITIFLVDDLT